MLKDIALALLFLACQLGRSPRLYTLEEYENCRALKVTKVTCEGEALAEGFSCAILSNFDPPLPDGIAAVSGGQYDLIRGITLILDGTLYTTVFDPPLKKENGFSGLEKGAGILARVDGDYLWIRLPNGKEAKAKIARRETMNPNRPQPA